MSRPELDAVHSARVLFGWVLRLMREAAGLTRAKVAADTGLSRFLLEQIEAGRHPMRPWILRRLQQSPALADSPKRALRSLLQAYWRGLGLRLRPRAANANDDCSKGD